MYGLLRKVLFSMNPEEVHYLVMDWLKRAYRLPITRNLMRQAYKPEGENLARTLWGLKFKNPVGLAAGFDKDARWTDELDMLGFGFIEIGTLTHRPQPGNDKPRLFRLPLDKGLINRMGFNNGGVDAAVERLRQRKEKGLSIGGNIGKNKVTPNAEAYRDYEACFRALHPVVDYFVVNVSSPNTPGLRELQDKEPLTMLLSQLQVLNGEMGRRPLLLKIAPDLTNEQLDDIIEIVKSTGIDGVIATNTTIAREGLATDGSALSAMGAGGLSGLPLRARATEVVRYLYERSGRTMDIIAAGGVFSAADAQEKLDAGAKLVQVYTGFVYEGPGIVKRICAGLK
jgi:dihydroorotate dehydrogenase